MDIKLPNLGEGADSGIVVNLFVKEGDSIEKGQAILELENEKAVASIPATASGVVSKIFVKAGDKISVGQKLVSIEGTESTSPAPQPEKSAPKVEAKQEIEVSEDDPDEPSSPLLDQEEVAVVVSLTHLRLLNTNPFSPEVRAYQTLRTKKLARNR